MSTLLQKANEYKKKILSRKIRLSLSVLFAFGLFAVSCRYLYDGINKRFVIYAVLCVLTALFFACPTPESGKIRALFLLLYIIVVPYKIFQRIELPVHDMSLLSGGSVFVNITIILMTYALLLLFLRHFHLAFGIGNILFFVLFLLNYYHNQSQGSCFQFYHWEALKTALPVMNSLQPAMSNELWYSILYFCFFIAFGFWCVAPRAKASGHHLTVALLALGFLVCSHCFFYVSGYLEKKDLRLHRDTPWADERQNGFLLSLVLGLRDPQPEEKEWYEKFPVVCHALGQTREGDAGTNSKEALEYNYAMGQRVFEADISIASDGVAVLRHDWDFDLGQAEKFGWTEEAKRVPTSEEFLQAPIHGKYTPMALLDLYGAMAQRKDMYVIIDPKYNPDVRSQFTILVNTALHNGYEDVLDRVIVQLYYEEMYAEVEAVYHFDHYLYTLYYIGYPDPASTGTFCQKNDIPVVVMPYTWITPAICQDMQKYSLRLYGHTVNTPEDAQHMASLCVDGIYSDHFLPKQMEEWLLQINQGKDR